MPVGFPLPVTWGAGILATPAADQDIFEQDTLDMLDTCGETLAIKRRANTWVNGKSTVVFADIANISGEWQPISGSVTYAEAGLHVKSTAQVFCLIDLDIEEDDRVVRIDGTFLYVNYIQKQSDHWLLMLTATEPI